MKSFDKRWEEIHAEREWGKYPNEEIIKFVARNYYKKDRGNTKILDAGCGIGAVAWFLSREGFDTYAFDGSKSAIERAENRFQKENLKCNFEIQDALNITYSEETFDAVIDSAMIASNTSTNVITILKNFNKILRKGGKVFSTALFEVGMYGYGTGEKIEEHTFRNIEKGNVANIGTIHFFDRNQIIDYWTQGGFKNIKIDYITRTDFGGETEVRYFIVEAEK